MAAAAEILDQLHHSGVHLRAEGDRLIAESDSPLTDNTRALIREHKAELMEVLAGPLPDPAAEARRQRVLELLAANPGARYALVTDLESDPEAVILALAIRGRATCELRIPRAKYDPFLLLDLIERNGATVH